MALLSSLAICTLLFLTLPISECLITEEPLPQQLKECYQRYASKSLSVLVGKSVCWRCEAAAVRKIERTGKQLSSSQQSYVNDLYRTYRRQRVKRQASRCQRKEYRLLSDEERDNFHRAVNLLKQDTSILPNKYDAIALLHAGTAALNAHGGPNFLSFHRVYLGMLESALQSVVPGTCIPYIDNTIESEVDPDEVSYLFSDKFMGTANGVVISGPFANWTTPRGQLTRNVGVAAVPMSKTELENIMSRNSIEEITAPFADPDYELEYFHGSMHMFIGGQMESLETASFDPIFFLHHCYIDKVWEDMRRKVRSMGGDPTIVPEDPARRMVEQESSSRLGIGSFLVADGFSDDMITFEYQPEPTCTRRNPSCGSKYLTCKRDNWRCVPVDPTQNPDVNPPKPPCPKRDKKKYIRTPKSCQNTFCADGKCDVNQWLYIPVKIITNRAPEFKGTMSYPVRNGHVETSGDIYSPQGYSNVNFYVRPGPVQPKGYSNCEDTHGIGQIFISSQGINYEGYYSESSIVDQRITTSLSIAYIAVKNMGRSGKSVALLRAFDNCGRICHTACKVPGSNPARYRPCSGVVSITPDLPKGYGVNYGDALLDVWDYRKDRQCPDLRMDDFFVSFYCDYKDRLPWVEPPPKHAAEPVVPPTPPPPPPPPAQSCQISPRCTIDISCENKRCSTYGEKRACSSSCSRYYVICLYGQYRIRSCSTRMHFDATEKTCVPGTCTDTNIQSNFRRQNTYSMFNRGRLGWGL